MSGWGCPHEVRSFCQRLKKKCDPGVPGCVLYGLVERADVPMPARGGASGKPRRRDLNLRRKKEKTGCRTKVTGSRTGH